MFSSGISCQAARNHPATLSPNALAASLHPATLAPSINSGANHLTPHDESPATSVPRRINHDVSGP